jgi:hypothetical protein
VFISTTACSLSATRSINIKMRFLSRYRTSGKAYQPAESRDEELAEPRSTLGRDSSSMKPLDTPLLPSRKKKKKTKKKNKEYEVMIDRIPTAVSYNSNDSQEEAMEERSKASRYSVEGKRPKEEGGDKDGDEDDRYSQQSRTAGVERLWSNSTDSEPARWRSWSEDDKDFNLKDGIFNEMRDGIDAIIEQVLSFKDLEAKNIAETMYEVPQKSKKVKKKNTRSKKSCGSGSAETSKRSKKKRAEQLEIQIIHSESGQAPKSPNTVSESPDVVEIERVVAASAVETKSATTDKRDITLKTSKDAKSSKKKAPKEAAEQKKVKVPKEMAPQKKTKRSSNKYAPTTLIELKEKGKRDLKSSKIDTDKTREDNPVVLSLAADGCVEEGNETPSRSNVIAKDTIENLRSLDTMLTKSGSEAVANDAIERPRSLEIMKTESLNNGALENYELSQESKISSKKKRRTSTKRMSNKRDELAMSAYPMELDEYSLIPLSDEPALVQCLEFYACGAAANTARNFLNWKPKQLESVVIEATNSDEVVAQRHLDNIPFSPGGPKVEVVLEATDDDPPVEDLEEAPHLDITKAHSFVREVTDLKLQLDDDTVGSKKRHSKRSFDRESVDSDNISITSCEIPTIVRSEEEILTESEATKASQCLKEKNAQEKSEKKELKKRLKDEKRKSKNHNKVTKKRLRRWLKQKKEGAEEHVEEKTELTKGKRKSQEKERKDGSGKNGVKSPLRAILGRIGRSRS